MPIDPENSEAIKNRKALKKLEQCEKPFLTIFGDKNPITRGAEKVFQKRIPGARRQNHATLDAGHFIQEDKGEELADLVIDFYTANNK